MKLHEVMVTCGPGPLAYKLKDGMLHIWTGEYIEDAPPDATFVEIADDHNSWYITELKDTPDE